MAIVLGLPKGSLQESTFALFKRAGFNVSCSSRSYYPTIDDAEITCRLLRPQEMSRYVELGLLDAGICGWDWVYENGSDVEDVCELSYSKATSNPVRWVLAVPNDSKIKSVKDLQGKRISTEALGIVTLGHQFKPSNIHAGGLRYHGAGMIVSQLIKDGYMKGVDIPQLETFEAGMLFARTEGIIPAPESCHAIAATIREAKKCKETGEEKVILFNLSGHGLIDMPSYEQFISGDLQNYSVTDEEIEHNVSQLEQII